MKRILSVLSMILILTLATPLFLFSCGDDSKPGNAETTPEPGQNDNTATVPETATQPTTEAATEPKPEAFVFTYDFSGKTTKLPTPTPEKLPSSWKGFNLLNLFYLGGSPQFEEEEFQMMSEWGFTFVRLPMDYRYWSKQKDWSDMDEKIMRQIDKAIEYGIKYDIHVCLNFHRAPGYTVASPAESTDLWTQSEPQEAFARMWAEFARRYKNVPNEYLSFNFVNEPPDISEKVYAAVIEKAAKAIREQDPNRLLIADGLSWGNKPSKLIKELGIAQATRGYQPFNLTHYLASWVEGSENYPLPSWPVVIVPKFLYNPSKSDVPWSLYSIEHDFSEAYNLDVNIGTVSNEAKFIVKADGVEIYNKQFRSGKGEGEWTKEVYREEWNVYQNIFDKDYRIEIPAGTKLLTLEVKSGDWMTINDMKFTSVSGNGKAFSFTPNTDDWGAVIPPVTIDADGVVVLAGAGTHDKDWLRETYLKPWEELIKGGGGAMVGEWGSHSKTPHDVVLRWMDDCLQNFKDAGLGWALWNLNGSFGILNSGRADVKYEDYNGYKLDREMLDLLLKYLD